MAPAYSEDLRIRVIRSVEEDGESARGAGRRFGISESSAVTGVGRFRREGSVAAKKTGRPRGWTVAAPRALVIGRVGGWGADWGPTPATGFGPACRRAESCRYASTACTRA